MCCFIEMSLAAPRRDSVLSLPSDGDLLERRNRRRVLRCYRSRVLEDAKRSVVRLPPSAHNAPLHRPHPIQSMHRRPLDGSREVGRQYFSGVVQIEDEGLRFRHDVHMELLFLFCIVSSRGASTCIGYDYRKCQVLSRRICRSCREAER